MNMGIQNDDRVHGPCIRAVDTGRVHGPWTRPVLVISVTNTAREHGRHFGHPCSRSTGCVYRALGSAPNKKQHSRQCLLIALSSVHVEWRPSIMKLSM